MSKSSAMLEYLASRRVIKVTQVENTYELYKVTDTDYALPFSNTCSKYLAGN